MKLDKKEWLEILNECDNEIRSKRESMTKILGQDRYPVPYNFHLKYYYEKDIIKKEDLTDDTFYFGLCRNAGIAKWDTKENAFWYLRFKFGSYFFEKINHISNDDGYDLFLPTEVYNKEIK
jgi:hypothetical protein